MAERLLIVVALVVTASVGCSRTGYDYFEEPPVLAVAAVTTLTTPLRIGQHGLALEVTVENRGETYALLLLGELEVDPREALTAAALQSGLPTLAPGSSAVLTFLADVSSALPPQPIAILPRIAGVNPANALAAEADVGLGPWLFEVQSCSPVSHASLGCADGDLYWFDGCGSRQERRASCLGMGCVSNACVSASRCPADMVQVGGSAMCIDVYEATLFASPACAGTRFGAGSLDDYPAGFPDNVESISCGGLCEGVEVVPATTEVYACSVGGVFPSANLTWFQAKRACENAGKRLCLPADRIVACRGPTGARYPYGNDVDPQACNGASNLVWAALPTGAKPKCEGGYPGLFDMLFNLWEWVATCSAPNCYRAGGSYYNVDDGYGHCSALYATLPNTSAKDIGVRCCLDL